jgi:hypothetical protein
VNEQDHDAGGKADPVLEDLQGRVHRLEHAVASLQDTRALEERVIERVRQRLPTALPVVAGKVDDRVVDSQRHPAPRAMDSAASKTLSGATPANAALALATLPPAARAAATAVLLPRHRWLLWDVWTELVAIVRMFLDVRYHVGWFARLAVLVLVPVILTSHLWLWLPVSLFGITDKLVDLLLAFFLYKTLTREAGRYREWRAQLHR